MPNYIENFGLDFLLEKDETTMGFMSYLAQNGKPIVGYYNCPTFFNGMGNIDFFLQTSKTEDGSLQVVGLDTHCSGKNVWEMRNTGIDITPKAASITERLFMFKKNEDGSGLLPIHLINADVLPSFLEDDVVRMQICALALNINYYANEEDYENSYPEDENGKRFIIADGSMLSISFLHNHSLDNNDANEEFANDDVVLFAGTVKQLYCGKFEMGENRDTTFIRCVIDTQFGEIEVIHSIDQVDENDRENLQVGAIISGTCILSGDVAIYEYENGIVKDFDHDFRLVKQVISKGQAERMRTVLNEDSIYISETSNKTYIGPNEIIGRLDYVNSNQQDKCFVHTATITQIDDESLEYDVGTRCLVISYDTEENYSAITFIDVDTAGMITKILITTDSRYHFKIDEPIRDHSFFDDIDIPNSIFEPIYNRACFHNMIEDTENVDELINNIAEYALWENNAKNMIQELKSNPQDNTKVALENVFGYLFAKAVEKTVASKHSSYNNCDLIVSYHPFDAFAGKIQSFFSCEDDIQKIALVMEKGKQFFKDFTFYTQRMGNDENKISELLLQALVFVQHIGSLYADKLFE